MKEEIFQRSKIAKLILTSIWRALCERKKYKVVLKPDNPLLLLYDVPEGYILNAILKRGTEEIVTTTDPSNLFSGEYPL